VNAPKQATRIERFCKTTRWFHWTFALSFLGLAGTGAALTLREAFGIGPEAADALAEAHEVLAIVLLTAPWLVGASGDTRRWLVDLAEIARFDRLDLEWLRIKATPWRSRDLPPQHKLNAGQKLNALAILALSVVLTASGVHLWREPAAFVALALHLAAFVAWLPAFGVHLFMVFVYPPTRPALRGMLRGSVSREWARQHHQSWVESEESR